MGDPLRSPPAGATRPPGSRDTGGDEIPAAQHLPARSAGWPPAHFVATLALSSVETPLAAPDRPGPFLGQRRICGIRAALNSPK